MSTPLQLTAGIFVIWAGALVAITLVYPKPAIIMDENLEKFRELTASDPLFYDPAMDAGFLQESVAEMKHQDDLILYVDRMFRPNGDPKYRDVFPEEWRLWPDEFLATLPYIHVATKKFLDAPSREGALILLDWHEKSAASYKKAIDLHIQAMENIFRANPKVPKTKIIFLGSGTTPEIVYNDFRLIQKNALKLAEEIAQRKQCLYYGRCLTENRDPIPVNTGIGSLSEHIPFEPLPNEILGIKPEDKVFGPYWAETPCFGRENNLPIKHPFYIKKMPFTYKNFWLKAKLTNQKYYRDYSVMPDQLEAKFGLQHGIKVWPHFETNDYLCTDLRYLTDLYNQFLIKNGVVKNEKLATLPYLIQNTLAFGWFTIYYPTAIKNTQSPFYLLTARSSYSLYFGTFSPAIWRVSETPQFLLRQTFDTKSGYITYSDLLKKLNYEKILDLNKLPPLFKEIYTGAKK